MPNSQPAKSVEEPRKSAIFDAAVSQVSEATSSGATPASPEGKVRSQTSNRPACAM